MFWHFNLLFPFEKHSGSDLLYSLSNLPGRAGGQGGGSGSPVVGVMGSPPAEGGSPRLAELNDTSLPTLLHPDLSSAGKLSILMRFLHGFAFRE